MEQYEIHFNDPVAYERADEDLTDEELLARAHENFHVDGAEPEFYIEEAIAPEYEGERTVYAHHIVVEGDSSTDFQSVVDAHVTNTAQCGNHQLATHIRPVSDFSSWEPRPENILRAE